jgi:signal transduction histidine kinase
MLRGYIEIFEDELADQLDEELADYMVKMRASAEQLTVFVTNILNVARVEENQLFLHLHEEQWAETLNNIIKDIEPRAKAHGYEIELSIQHSMPTVAVDKVSISEVIGNLIDNAIKYSTENKKIIVRSYLRDDGQVETTVQDFGIGIPNSIIGNLFEKFYRNHRSKAQVGGTGLGLYLSKAIVSAHGGQIWVKSKEGEGSVFGFSLQNYADLADELKSSDNKDIKRTAYGWIKNHSFYRK